MRHWTIAFLQPSSTAAQPTQLSESSYPNRTAIQVTSKCGSCQTATAASSGEGKAIFIGRVLSMQERLGLGRS